MLDPGTILAIVSLAAQVIDGVTKVIGLFDSISNAPEELREFQISASRLQRHFSAFQADLEVSGFTALHRDDVQEIEETLILCNQLFSEHEDVLRNQAGLNGTFRATWTTRSNGRLTRYKAKIDTHYQQILLPAWVISLSQRRREDLVTGESGTPPKNTSESQDASPVIRSDEIEALTQGISDLKSASGRELTQRSLSILDETLQKCWSRLGIPVEDVFNHAGFTVDGRRTSSISYEVAPTTLILETAADQHKRLELNRVHIMARDDQSRILQYQNSDMSIHVTQIIPYGSIPWTESTTSRRISFLNPHVITVVDGEGYHLYHIDPKYKFRDLKTSRAFQSTLRERDLLDTYMAVDISQGGLTLSRRQVLRFWAKRSSTTTKITTITFLESSVGSGRNHREIEIRLFRPEPTFVVPRNWAFGRHRVPESETVELVSVVPKNTLRIKFEGTQEAKDFAATFKQEHPSNRPAPAVELTHLASTSTSLSATPAATPSDSLWSAGVPPSDASFLSLDMDPDDFQTGDMSPMETSTRSGTKPSTSKDAAG